MSAFVVVPTDAFSGSDDATSLQWSLPRRQQRPALSINFPEAAERPQWTRDVIRRLTELASLPGVDPRGSDPMNVEDLIDALTFVRTVMQTTTVSPWIGLLNTGGLQLNWRNNDVEVEAVFDRARDDRVVYVSVGDREWEAPISDGHSLFATVVDRLAASDVEPHALA
jgi:hypothetical protein